MKEIGLKLTELKIGNYINDNDIIVGIYHNEWITLGDKKWNNEHDMKPRDCNPIPLTEQWLKDFGFKKCNRTEFEASYETKNKKYVFQFAQNGLLILIDCEYTSFFQLITAVNYVHQLQNLYFALTGIELTKS